MRLNKKTSSLCTGELKLFIRVIEKANRLRNGGDIGKIIILYSTSIRVAQREVEGNEIPREKRIKFLRAVVRFLEEKEDIPKGKYFQKLIQTDFKNKEEK